MGTWCHGQRGKEHLRALRQSHGRAGKEQRPEEGGPLLVSMVGDADVSRADPRKPGEPHSHTVPGASPPPQPDHSPCRLPGFSTAVHCY